MEEISSDWWKRLVKSWGKLYWWSIFTSTLMNLYLMDLKFICLEFCFQFCYIIHILLEKIFTYHFPLLVAYFIPKLVTRFKWIWKLNGHWDKSTHHVSILSVFGLAFGSHPKLEKTSTLIENSLIQPYSLYNLSTFTSQL